jgi:hypothetical protein
MEPAIHDGELVLVDTGRKAYEVGRVVVFRGVGTGLLVKRVTAVDEHWSPARPTRRVTAASCSSTSTRPRASSAPS